MIYKESKNNLLKEALIKKCPIYEEIKKLKERKIEPSPF